MHITNPIDGLFTLKDFAKANGNTLMDVVNVLNVVISQKLVNKTNREKVEKVIKKVWVDYEKLKNEWISFFSKTFNKELTWVIKFTSLLLNSSLSLGI